MPAKRIIPCLDIKEGRVVKGTNFVDLKDAGDPVELAERYYKEGADELVFLDISASGEKRKTFLPLVRDIAVVLRIPFTVGGGISENRDIELLLKAGADKVSLNTAAVLTPGLITEAAREFGEQAVVGAIDAKQTGTAYTVYTHGGKRATTRRAAEWAAEMTSLGAGEILLTSMDKDGTGSGFDIPLLREICKKVTVPVIASGGAGSMEDFADVFLETDCSAALAAGLFHRRELGIPELKEFLLKHDIEVRI